MNRVGLVTVGDELLNGAVVDTSTGWLGEQLGLEGFALVYSISVVDDLAAISDAILVALARVDAVIVTGGLGPTSDDLTREGIARAARVPVETRLDLVELISQRYASRGLAMPANALLMAVMPEGAQALVNEGGSAPGIYATIDEVPLFALPGVPSEMRAMYRSEVSPRLKAHLKAVERRTAIIRISLQGESQVAEALKEWEVHSPDGISIAYLAGLGEVQVKVSAPSWESAFAYARQAGEILGDSVYAIDDAFDSPTLLSRVVLAACKQQGVTLTTAESLTGGLIAEMITDIPGASEFFLGGVVAYSVATKHALLEVPREVMATHGMVSKECAKAMARGARERTGADLALSTTGVAGPGEFEGHRAGTLFLGVSTTKGTQAFRIRLSGQMGMDRERVRRASALYGLDLLRRNLWGLPPHGGTEQV